MPDHVSREAENALRDTASVLYLVSDPMAEKFILECNANARNLYPHYLQKSTRMSGYSEIARDVIAELDIAESVCMAVYGHPRVGVDPVRLVLEGLESREPRPKVRVLPGISADACMYVDLGLDPFRDGLQAYEATQLMQRKPKLDPRTPLVVWQAGAFQSFQWPPVPDRGALDGLSAYLLDVFGPNAQCIVYQASWFDERPTRVDSLRVREIAEQDLSLTTTLMIRPFVPESPKGLTPVVQGDAPCR